MLVLMFMMIIKFIVNWGLGIGDWGLPNPQSPNHIIEFYKVKSKYL